MKTAGFKGVVILLVALFIIPVSAHATNGVNLNGIGAVSRAMGGTGTAYSLDTVTAISTNPAAMSFASYAGSSQFDFGNTFFMPTLETKVTNGTTKASADGDKKIYPAPAIGISVPVSSTTQFGIAAYGASGLGTDFRGTAIDGNDPNGNPWTATTFSQAGILKFVGAFSHKYNEQLSTGIALHIDNGSLDVGNGTSFGYALGAQLGAIYKSADALSFGLTYTTPQKVEHKDVLGAGHDFSFESPNIVAVGTAYKPMKDKLLLAADVKWLNWGDAEGWKDLDYEDQWVFAVGAEYKATDKMALRAGYNYGKNPLKKNNNFDGTQMVSVQGTQMPRYYYETFRIVGAPLILEHHVSIGMGYNFTDKFALNLGIVKELENSMRERGTDALGNPASMKTDLSAYSVDFGLTWNF